MTRSLFLKLNMAIVFVVVLFAGTVFADQNTDRLRNFLNENLSFFDAGSISDRGGVASNVYVDTSRTTFKIDANTLRTFKNNNIALGYRVNVDNIPTFYAKDLNTGVTVELKVNVKGEGEFGFRQVRLGGVRLSGGEDKNNYYFGNSLVESNDNIDVILTDRIDQIGDKSIYFAVDSVSNNATLSNTLFVYNYIGTDGTTETETVDREDVINQNEENILPQVWGIRRSNSSS